MMTQQYNKNRNSKNNSEIDTCEATYFIIDSISTQYVDSEVKDDFSNEESAKVDSISNNDDISQAIQNLGVSESVSMDKTSDDKNSQDKTKHNKNIKQVDLKKQITPPTKTHWLNTYNIAIKTLDLERSDAPTDKDIAATLFENHTTETYVELLHKIAENNSHLQFKEIDGEIQVKTSNKTLHVSIDHFHSYLRHENDIECIVCDMTFSENDGDVHKYDVRHMNHVVKNIDYRGFRKVNYSYSHCITCNIRVQKKKHASAHVKTQHHIKTRNLAAKTALETKLLEQKLME